MRRASAWTLRGIIALGALASVNAVAQAPKPAPAPKTAASATQSNLPYDITADQQEMFNEEHRTVYRGNVVVIQGTDRLNTPQLTLIFDKKDPNAPTKAPPAGAAASPTSTFGKVKQMEAEGPVYFNTPTQNAKGDHGTYLASDDTITLIGNVVLVQNKDVSTGDKLVINRTTDRYTLFSKGGPKERVRGVFYQDQPQNGQAGAPAKPAKPTGPTHP